jgi:hypothetical protein
MKLVDMKRPKLSKKELKTEVTAPGEEDRYPWGLRLRFDEKEIGKIKVLQKLNIGDTVKIEAIGEVVQMFKRAEKNRDAKESLEIQITKIGVANQNDDEAAFNEED